MLIVRSSKIAFRPDGARAVRVEPWRNGSFDMWTRTLHLLIPDELADRLRPFVGAAGRMEVVDFRGRQHDGCRLEFLEPPSPGEARQVVFARTGP